MIKLAAARMSEPLALPVIDGVAAAQLTRTWTDLSSSDGVSAEQLRREQLRLGTTVANYMCHAAVRDFFAGRRTVDSAKSHLATLANLQLTVDSSTGGSAAASSQSVPMSVAVLEKLVIDGQSELGRLSSAYTLGYMAATGDKSALVALLALAQGTVERGRRAAWYGLTVGGPLACDALLQLLPEMSSELAMNAAHALGQAAAPVATAEDHARAVAICNVLMTRLQHTRVELLEYSGGFVQLEDTGTTNRPILPDFFATDRRRVLAECMASLALLTQHALRFRSDLNSSTSSIEAAKYSAANSALAVTAAEALLPLLLEPEPGVAFPSYMAPEYCRWNAANALLRICSASTEGVSRPSVPTFR
jgi:HEAT repeat protein